MANVAKYTSFRIDHLGMRIYSSDQLLYVYCITKNGNGYITSTTQLHLPKLLRCSNDAFQSLESPFLSEVKPFESSGVSLVWPIILVTTSILQKLDGTESQRTLFSKLRSFAIRYSGFFGVTHGPWVRTLEISWNQPNPRELQQTIFYLLPTYHQTFQVPKIWGTKTHKLFWGWVFPYIRHIHI